MKFFLVIVAIIATIQTCQGLQRGVPEKDLDLRELSAFEKILVRTSHPELNIDECKGLRSSKNGILSYYGLTDEYGFDIPTLFLLLTKLGNEFQLPDWHYEFGFSWCYMGVCISFWQIHDWRDTIIYNADETRMNTQINSTHIRVKYEIPDLQIVSPRFTLNDTDFVENTVTFWRGWSFLVKNYVVEASGEFQLVPEVGLQISNFDVNFGADDYRFRKENATHTIGGISEEWGPVETQYSDWFKEDFAKYKNETLVYYENFFNCKLSNGRSPNINCDEHNDAMSRDTFIQVLQAIGLGIIVENRGS